MLCKVCLRVPYGGPSAPDLVGTLARQFLKAALLFKTLPQTVSCFRCGIQEVLPSLDSHAKVVKASSLALLSTASWISLPRA